MMKIFIPVKSVLDPDNKITVSGDGKSIDDSNGAYILNYFDAIAIEEALRLIENGLDAEIILASIGGDHCEKTLRTGLAMGADRAYHVEQDGFIDPWNVANILESLIQKENPDLIIMGKQATDDDSNQVGQFLAAKLNLPQATFISKITIQGNEVSVDRESDFGIEEISLSLPAVITCDLRLNEPRYASVPAILKAKRKPIEKTSVSDLGVSIEPKLEVLEFSSVSTSRNCEIVEDIPTLINKLKSEAKVLA